MSELPYVEDLHRFELMSKLRRPSPFWDGTVCFVMGILPTVWKNGHMVQIGWGEHPFWEEFAKLRWIDFSPLEYIIRLTHFLIQLEWELVRSVSESERNTCESLLIVFLPPLECEKTGLKSYKSKTQVGHWFPNNLVVCFRLSIAPRFAHRNSPPNP